MRTERPDHTLQPTAVVNAALVRLMEGEPVSFENRAHFFAIADTLDVWDEARDAARQFWARGSEDARLSDDVRAICEINAQLLAGNSHDIALAERSPGPTPITR
jgi:hypothetical protein